MGSACEGKAVASFTLSKDELVLNNEDRHNIESKVYYTILL